MAAATASLMMKTGCKIPKLGLGVYRSKPGPETYNTVRSALKLGYRHIDTAQFYENEDDVGAAIADSGIPREEIFLTSKLVIDNWGYRSARRTTMDSIKRLKTPYIDLFLLHAPGEAKTRDETWRALEELQEEGMLRNIGVSNFGIPHLEKLKKTAKVLPVVNQVELHPWLQWRDVVAYCNAEGIVLTAYSPLVKGWKMDDPTLTRIAQRHGVTPAQVLVAFSLHNDWVCIPKTGDVERQKENLKAAELTLTEQDIEELRALDSHLVTGWNPIEEDEV